MKITIGQDLSSSSWITGQDSSLGIQRLLWNMEQVMAEMGTFLSMGTSVLPALDTQGWNLDPSGRRFAKPLLAWLFLH